MTIQDLQEYEKLKELLAIKRLKRGLVEFNSGTNPNYVFLYNSLKDQQYDEHSRIISGYRGCVLEGSSRSGKTWSGVDFIIYLCTVLEKNCTINIYRETYNEFKTTLYDDFKNRLDHFGLKNPFHEAKDVKSFKIGKNNIFFLGDGKHGGGCDYAFYNEGMFIDKSVFDQSEMRCRKFWWMDYNPSFTEHWVFNEVIPRYDVGFLRTTFHDNKHISPQERSKIQGYECWESGCYEVVGNLVMYNGKPVTDKNQPPRHEYNHEQGTANEFMHRVYGLGLRGAMKGVIFQDVHYVDEPPDFGFSYGLDFGFTVDPSVLTRVWEDENNIWIEYLSYQPVETPEDMDMYFDSIGIDRGIPIACDSSDKFTGQNKGTVEMVSGLRELGWEVFKVSKTKSVMYWLNSMRRKKIHVIKNRFLEDARKEFENYRFKEINGIAINQPIDKYNHGIDSARYAHMSQAHNYDIYY